jgi:hypothetical protein
MQKWDYRSIVCNRRTKIGIGVQEAKDWNQNIVDLLPKLGQDGWDLSVNQLKGLIIGFIFI